MYRLRFTSLVPLVLRTREPPRNSFTVDAISNFHPSSPHAEEGASLLPLRATTFSVDTARTRTLGPHTSSMSVGPMSHLSLSSIALSSVLSSLVRDVSSDQCANRYTIPSLNLVASVPVDLYDVIPILLDLSVLRKFLRTLVLGSPAPRRP